MDDVRLLYFLTGLIALALILKDRGRGSTDDFDDLAPKGKNEDALIPRIIRHFQPSQKGRYFHTHAPWWSVLLRTIYATFGTAWVAAFLMVPIVWIIFAYPPDYEGSLSEFNSTASSIVGFSFFIGLFVGLLYLRKFAWMTLTKLFGYGLLLAVLLTIVHDILF